MRTVIIGGGKGCQALLELVKGAFLKELTLDVVSVMDIDMNAPGMIYARMHGILTFTDMTEALSMPDVDLVIELTGSDTILEEIHKRISPKVRLIDHTFARIFWDLVNAQEIQKQQVADLMDLERKIEKERRHIQSVFDNIPELVVVLDRDKRVIRTNTRFSEYTGLPMDQIVGRRCSEVATDANLPIDCAGYCPFEEVLNTGETKTRFHQTPPPKEAFWEITHSPILNRQGKTEAVIETWHRITEMVKMRREIEHAELRFMRFIESANDLISIKNNEGRYELANQKTAEVFGLTKEMFIGKRAEEILPKGVAMIINHHDQEVLEKKVHRTYEEVIQINGRDHYFSTVRFPLTDYQGNAVGTCTIARDVTKRKQLEHQLVQSTKLAAVGKLAAGVAHEINNPLTGILAFAEDMRDEVPEDNPMHEDLKVIVRETLRCREIVRNLLDFSRQDDPKLEVRHPNDVVLKSLTLVEKLPRFKNITIRKELRDDIPQINVDPSQLEQVILNFMLNAGDAMKDKGTIVLTTDYDRRSDQVVISVEDTGPGIPENLIDKVFEPFFSSKGTSGLGLAVSWGIVERHRGTIEVDTAESGGAIFRILLPASLEW